MLNASNDLHSLQQLLLLWMRSERSSFLILVLNISRVGDVLNSLLSLDQINGPWYLIACLPEPVVLKRGISKSQFLMQYLEFLVLNSRDRQLGVRLFLTVYIGVYLIY